MPFMLLTTPMSPFLTTNAIMAGSCVAMPPLNAASLIEPGGVQPISPRPPVPCANGFHVDSPQIEAVAPAAATLDPPNRLVSKYWYSSLPLAISDPVAPPAGPLPTPAPPP